MFIDFIIYCHIAIRYFMSYQFKHRSTPKRVVDPRSFHYIRYPRIFPNISKLRIGAILNSVINTKQNTLSWFRENGLLPIGMYCKCGTPMNERIKLQMVEGVAWRCPKKRCRNTTSVRQRSLFSRTAQPLQEIVWFLYLWAEDLVETEFVINNLGWSKGVVLEWKRMLRQICKYNVNIDKTDTYKRKPVKYELKFNGKRKWEREKEIEDERVEMEWREKFGEEPLSSLVSQIREIIPVT